MTSTVRPRRTGRRRGIDDPGWISGGRVQELHLDPDDRPQAGLLGRGGESDDAVETLVVGDGEAAEAKLEGPLDEVLDRRRTVEEREVGVAVELGVGRLGHGWVPISGGGRWAVQNRTCVRS